MYVYNMYVYIYSNNSLNACSQLSGLPNSLTFNDIVTLNASSVDFSTNQSSLCTVFKARLDISQLLP